ncbi:MAG: hypothetical protein ACOCUM_00900 [Thiohalospira sp.]
MKKSLALLAMLGLLSPMTAFGEEGQCEADGIKDLEGGGTIECSDTDLDLLRSPVDLQVSDGTYLTAGETSAGGDIAIAAAHDGGNAAYAGVTGGGSVEEHTGSDFDPTDGVSAEEAAANAWSEADS